MNRKLFEIEKSSKTPIIWIGVIAISLLLGFVYQFKFNKQDSFLKFHGQSDYSPLTENGKGFYGKVNTYLQEALKDTSHTNYDIANLDSFYRRLKFYYPTDTADYLVSVDDIRLIEFEPDSNSKEQKAFYFNSDFRSIIEKQKRNLTQKYFNIKWDNTKTKIVGITIDTTLFNLSLQNDNWKGLVKFKDPFSKIDSNVKYLITENSIIPLFSSNADSADFKKNQQTRLGTINLQNSKKYSISEYEKIYESLNQSNPKNSRTILLNYHASNDNKEFSLRILNTGDKVFLQTQGVGISVYGAKNNVHAVHDTTLVIPNSFDNLKISLHPIVNLKKEIARLYISNISPFIASKPQNEGVTGERIHIDTSYLDLFSLQQVRQVETSISGKDNIDKVELSTNIVLSKYLEQEIKKYVSKLYSDSATFRKSPEDVFEMSVCLMDIATGEIIATPYYSNEFEKNNIDELTEQRNFNLIKHDIGSTFKPLISFAAYLKYKSLSQFQLLPNTTRIIGDTDFTILGYHNTIKYGVDKKTKEPNKLFWSYPYTINRKNFLSASHDNYPIALAMLALTEDNAPAYSLLTNTNLNNAAINNLYQVNGNETSRIRQQDKRIIFNNISNSSFINLLSNLYSVEAETKDSKYNIITYDTDSWNRLKTSKKNFYSLYPDIVYLGTERFGNANSDSEDFTKFKLFVLGQGDNRWTNIKLAEAYSRLLSKHKVTTTFIRNDSASFPYLFLNPESLFHSRENARYEFNITTPEAETTWNSFMTDWREAVKLVTPTIGRNTLIKAYKEFTTGVANHEDYYFYCKTGTPQEHDELTNTKVFKKGKDKIWTDEGLFVFGITNKDTNYPKGVVGVVYIKHLSLANPGNGVESSTARDFFTPDIYKKIMFYNQNRFTP